MPQQAEVIVFPTTSATAVLEPTGQRCTIERNRNPPIHPPTKCFSEAPEKQLALLALLALVALLALLAVLALLALLALLSLLALLVLKALIALLAARCRNIHRDRWFARTTCPTLLALLVLLALLA